jgi:signal-transduction protein with cAMP-binding, CBS, and nucleotidyltransferase domain
MGVSGMGVSEWTTQQQTWAQQQRFYQLVHISSFFNNSME